MWRGKVDGKWIPEARVQREGPKPEAWQANANYRTFDHKVKRVSTSAPTKTRAIARLEERKDDVRRSDGLLEDGGATTVAQAVEGYMECRAEQRRDGRDYEYVFGRPRAPIPEQANAAKRLRKLFDLADLKDCAPHTLRRTMERRLEISGATASERETIMGHTAEIAHRHYASRDSLGDEVLSAWASETSETQKRRVKS